MTHKALPRLAIAAILCLLALPALALDEITPQPDPTSAPATFSGDAPLFEITAYDGSPLNLRDYGGTPTILHFWASWQRASYGDTVFLQDLYETGEIDVIGLNHFDPENEAFDFLETTGITYPVAPDSLGNVARDYDLDGVPFTVIIDAEGNIQDRISGPLTRRQLYTALDLERSESMPVEAPVPPDALTRYDDFDQHSTDSGYPVLGHPDAEVTLENFSSFACPFCQGFHDVVFVELMDFVAADDLQVIYVPIYNTGDLPNSLEANQAALCAHEQDQFWIYSDMLYDWHNRYIEDAFTPERLRQGAINLGLDLQAWQSCLDSDEVQEILNRAVEEMRTRDYAGTPTIIINDERAPISLERIRERIEAIVSNRV